MGRRYRCGHMVVQPPGAAIMTKRTPANLTLLRQLAAGGATVSEAARALGIVITTAQNWAASERITFPTRSQARKKALADPEVRARMSAASKKALADPEVRARMSAASKKAWADPEVRARMSAASKKALADPEVRARMSAARKKAWADPEVRARIKASRRGAKGVMIPKWVPLDLHDEYLDTAAEQDEFAAARHIRHLLAELKGAAA